MERIPDGEEQRAVCGQRWQRVTCERPAGHLGEHHAVVEHEDGPPTGVYWPQSVDARNQVMADFCDKIGRHGFARGFRRR